MSTTSFLASISLTLNELNHYFLTIMIHLLLLVTMSFFHQTFSQQYYDKNMCDTNTYVPGTEYTCISSQKTCQTFVVYRANGIFPTVQTISDLFKRNPGSLLSINNVSDVNQVLEPGREVLVPITCSCSGRFFQANITYPVVENSTVVDISCGVFEGLVKAVTLTEEDRSTGTFVIAGSNLSVPLKCACPDNQSDVKFLITYPIINKDDANKISGKFNVSVQDICDANNMAGPDPTLYPTTTVLVPVKDKPLLNLTVVSDPPTPQFLPTENTEKRANMSKLEKLYISGAVVGFVLVVSLVVACCLYVKALRKFKSLKLTSRISSVNSFSTPKSSPLSEHVTRGSPSSCLSPDLLIGIKYSLGNYSVDDLKKATKIFSEDNEISVGVYKGVVENGDVMIKKMAFQDTRRLIDVHSKINHVNIVKLNGVCYGDDNFSCSYLVFEYPLNGSLRNCLSSSSGALHWHRRTQIAFDIATGLHYLHYSVTPSFTHLSLTGENVFLSSAWRAKVAVFGNADYLKHSGSEKVDIFAFGVVLLELISGKVVLDGKLCREAVKFLGGGVNEGSCFDQLRNFVDPCLKDDYPIAEALCLAVLAGSCVEDEPLLRPSMEDVLKILARMI